MLLGALSAAEPGRPWAGGGLHPDLVAPEVGAHRPDEVLLLADRAPAGPGRVHAPGLRGTLVGQEVWGFWWD